MPSHNAHSQNDDIFRRTHKSQASTLVKASLFISFVLQPTGLPAIAEDAVSVIPPAIVSTVVETPKSEERLSTPLPQLAPLATSSPDPVAVVTFNEDEGIVSPASPSTSTPQIAGSISVDDSSILSSQDLPLRGISELEATQSIAQNTASPTLTTDSTPEMALLEKEEKDLLGELKTEQKDQIVVKKETEALITELENMNGSEQKTQQLIDQLEKDEEKVEAETLQLIDKVEKLEAQAEKLQVGLLPDNSIQAPVDKAKTSQEETKEFVNALKERSADNLDLIETLKQKSKSYYNEKTGRYEAMSRKEFIKRGDEFARSENVAGKLLDRYRENISAEKEILMRPDGFLDKVSKLAKAEIAADMEVIENYLESESYSDLLVKLRSQAKAAEEFSIQFENFLSGVQSQVENKSDQ